MELKDIASVSGKGGLFKVVKPTRTGVILEALDDSKAKFIAGASHRVSILKEISLYTTSQEASLPLEDVFKKIRKDFGKDLPVNTKSSPDELRGFIAKVVPEYDEERVYPSDLKKLISWYELLQKHAPETIEEKKPETKAPKPEKAESKEKPQEEKEPKGKSKAAATETKAAKEAKQVLKEEAGETQKAKKEEKPAAKKPIKK